MTTTSTGGTVTISSPLTKNDIVKRLLVANQITFEEMLMLIQGEKEYVYIPSYPITPTYPSITTPSYPYFSYIKF